MNMSLYTAISTLLQPPILRTGLQPHAAPPASSAHKTPTTRDIPPVPLTNIPRIDAAEFRPYLSKISALYEQLQRAKDSETDTAPTTSSRSLSKTADDAHDDNNTHYRRPSSRGASVVVGTGPMSRRTSTSSADILGHSRRSSSAQGRRAHHQGPSPLSTIPGVYFEEDFHLENPRTFDVVSERSEVIRTDNKSATNSTTSTGPRKSLATNAILQEKLSWYMDTIEVHLINSISNASTTFFGALGSLRELHTEAADCVQRIRHLRQELMAIDHEIVSSGRELMQKKRRRENIQQLNDAVVQVRRVVEGLSYCEALVDGDEVDKALEAIGALELLISGEKDGPIGNEPSYQHGAIIDLRNAVALGGVNNDLNILRFRIGKSYETRFQDVLKADLQRHYKSASKHDVLLRWSSSSLRARGGHSREASAPLPSPAIPSYMQATDELRQNLVALLPGLHQANHVAAAVSAYREWIIHEIRSIVRRPLPSASDDDAESTMSSMTSRSSGRRQGTQEILARNLRALTPEDAEELWCTIYVQVAEAMRRLSTQAKILLDVASSVDNPSGGVKSPVGRSPLVSPTTSKYSDQEKSVFEEMHESLDLANLMGKAVDMAHDRIIRVLRVRSEQSTHLPLMWFLRYFTLNLYFATECESISGRSGTALKTIVNGHIMEFVKEHGTTEIQSLAQSMEADNWNVRDFDESDATLLAAVLNSGTVDPPQWFEDTLVYKPYHEEDEVPPPPPIAKDKEKEKDKEKDKEKEKARPAYIGEESWFLPYSAIICLRGINQFMRLTAGIPSLATDIGLSLVQYLQLFNSRCRQLILGAGATRSAGLRTITTKHLALAVRSVDFTATLIRYLRDFMRRHAGSSSPAVASLMNEFDRVHHQLQEHQDNIYQKLVEIMSGRAVVHSNALRSIDWTVPVEGTAHPYAEMLVKDTSMLHRVLSKFMPKPAVNMIMLPVFASFKEHLGKALREANAQTEAGRQSMLVDVNLLISKLSKIDGFSDLGDYLKSIVQAKEALTQPPPPLSKQSNSREEPPALGSVGSETGGESGASADVRPASSGGSSGGSEDAAAATAKDDASANVSVSSVSHPSPGTKSPAPHPQQESTEKDL
ncbi:Vacuolar protein sorting-associated protein 54, chloroplastic [Ceratocystis lukuohia]|uniref:Vacuolar protein sorting-associated protein 54, chloroplastic n=1 Tax=Ceratocystis lukuohia TaxID=2019550 RepID=A0ABR4MHR5_9PEZI